MCLVVAAEAAGVVGVGVTRLSKNKASEPCVWCQNGLSAVLVSLWLDFYLSV